MANVVCHHLYAITQVAVVEFWRLFCSGQPSGLTIQLHPATGACDNQKWVCLTLQISMQEEVCSGFIVLKTLNCIFLVD
jgi:hypothetical protein